MIQILFILASLFVSQPVTPVAQAQVIQPSFPISEDVATTTEAIVREVQKKYGLGDDFYNTAKCESSMVKTAVGDHGHSLGTWQINMPAWRSVSPQEAYDPRWSSEWAANQFLAGNADIWTCHRLLK